MRTQHFSERCLISALGLAALFGVSAAASAASVTLNGTNVRYTFDDTQFAGYGAAFNVAGDALSMDFTNFKALDLSPLTVFDQRDGTFIIDVELVSLTLTSLPNLTLFENGDYRTFELDSNKSPFVNAAGQFRVRNLLDGQSETIGFDTGSLSNLSLGTSPWNVFVATSSVDEWQTTKVRITLENLLLAVGPDAVDLAFIEKKLVRITAIPLPPAVWLLGSSLVGLVVLSRGRSRPTP